LKTSLSGDLTLAFSLVMLLLWAGGLIATVVWAFRRQDFGTE
jgi:hypothetical protein